MARVTALMTSLRSVRTAKKVIDSFLATRLRARDVSRADARGFRRSSSRTRSQRVPRYLDGHGVEGGLRLVAMSFMIPSIEVSPVHRLERSTLVYLRI